MTVDELKRRIIDAYDPDEVIEILELTTEELLAALGDNFIVEHSEKFFYLKDKEEYDT